MLVWATLASTTVSLVPESAGVAQADSLPSNLRIIERLALKWVQKYISAFGGDPSKVTM